MTSRALGNGLTQAYDYYDWNEQVNGFGQGGRLQNLTTGSLQNLTYTYDPVGNITSLTNVTAIEAIFPETGMGLDHRCIIMWKDFEVRLSWSKSPYK
jgi:hypothetical protein